MNLYKIYIDQNRNKYHYYRQPTKAKVLLVLSKFTEPNDTKILTDYTKSTGYVTVTLTAIYEAMT